VRAALQSASVVRYNFAPMDRAANYAVNGVVEESLPVADGGSEAKDTAARAGVVNPRVGMIVGPTGAGKTAFAITLAERLGAEIVNADSRQLYRGMDLGTAKPDAADRARVTHHLIDVCNPDRPIDVAEFAGLAQRAIAAIAGRGRPVLIVGGSGLYLRVLRGGIFAGPPASPAYRAELGALAAEHGAAYLHDRLCEADAEAARRIKVNDFPRIIRALEVFAASGIPISEHQRRHRQAGGGYVNLAIGLTVARDRLYDRIDRRFDAMIAAGLVEEVRGLLASGVRRGGAMAQTIGYREIARHLAGEIDLPAAIALAKRESRRLAKRQMTWFRREPGVAWLDPDHGLEEALLRFREFLHPEHDSQVGPR
jgi:tRNA dimethylallyltransferase